MPRSLLNAAALVLLTVFWSLVAICVVPWRPLGRSICRIARRWAKDVVRATGVEVELVGPVPPLTEAAYLVMANHTSHYDVISLFAVMPLDMRPVAKRELGYVPIFGWVLWAGAAIMIDRGERGRAIRSIERAARTIRAGRSVLMFPEGTRTPPGVLGALKKGPFYLAQEAGVPVLPVGIEGSGAVLPVGDWRIRSGRVRIRVGAPIPTTGLPAGEEGRERLRAQVESALGRLMGLGLDRPDHPS